MGFLETRGDTLVDLLDLANEMTEAARMLDAARKIKVRKIRPGSPNPQVRLALYFSNFVTACTGRPHYSDIKLLVDEGFHAFGEAPRWIDRLEIEKNMEAKHRRASAKAITVPHALTPTS